MPGTLPPTERLPPRAKAWPRGPRPSESRPEKIAVSPVAGLAHRSSAWNSNGSGVRLSVGLSCAHDRQFFLCRANTSCVAAEHIGCGDKQLGQSKPPDARTGGADDRGFDLTG